MKKSAKVLLYFGLDCVMLDSLLTSRNPKNDWCLSRISGARFGGKDHGLTRANPDPNKQEVGFILHESAQNFEILPNIQDKTKNL